MPKRSLDVATGGPGAKVHSEKIEKKGERSQAENKERAYIAASRRADRSIEARVQSARMASEIHKQRTGKGFKITEEIVMKEEMYEEEDDDLPRHYRYLSAGLHTSSPMTNSRLNDFVSTSVAMHAMHVQARLREQEEVDRKFAEAFPAAANQLAQSNYMRPLMNMDGHGHVRKYSTASSQASRDPHRLSVAHSMDMSPREAPMGSPLPMTPVTMTSGGSSHGTPVPGPPSPYVQTPVLAPLSPRPDVTQADGSLNAALGIPPSSSVFTAELPANIKQLVSLDWSDAMSSHLFGSLPMENTYNPNTPFDFSMSNDEFGNMDFFNEATSTPTLSMPPPGLKGEASTVSTTDWDQFINDDFTAEETR